VHQAPPPSDPRIARDAVARRAMLAMGYSETISFAFVEAAAAEPFAAGAAPIALANPLSETFAMMRPSVLPGVVDAVSHNRRHGRRDVRVFEIATAFGATGERRTLAAAWTGAAAGDHWSGHRRDVDMFDITGTVEALGRAYVATLTLDTEAPPWSAPAACSTRWSPSAGAFPAPRRPTSSCSS
jgi:phenylalanyl-tRNA synthetase beta chain